MSELPYLRSLVKHNVAAKHGSSKPLTTNELWLLELQIKSTCILASIPDALWDMCKTSINLDGKEINLFLIRIGVPFLMISHCLCFSGGKNLTATNSLKSLLQKMCTSFPSSHGPANNQITWVNISSLHHHMKSSRTSYRARGTKSIRLKSAF